MRLISWNVNGLRACVNKGFMDFFRGLDPDILCLQETKLQAGQIQLDTPAHHQYWNYAVKKGYSGTAVFTKEEPLSVKMGMDIPRHDERLTPLVSRYREARSFIREKRMGQTEPVSGSCSAR